MTLLRIAQEALDQRRPPRGDRPRGVDLSTRTGEVMLRVTDNGRGMAGEGVERRGTERLGVGIAGMRARVRQLGGELDIVSDAERTVVTARLPIVGGNGTRPRRHRVTSARDNDGE